MAEILEPNPYGPASEASVQELEQLIGHRLPVDYRAFLLAISNGGEPEPSHWHCGPTVDRPGYGWTNLSVSVDEFLSVREEGEQSSIQENLEVYDERIPAELVPIGADPGGNVICLQIAGDAIGSVWFWDHENEAEEGDPPWWNNLLPLAPSFTEFFDGLIDWDELERRKAADLRAVIEQGRPPRTS